MFDQRLISELFVLYHEYINWDDVYLIGVIIYQNMHDLVVFVHIVKSKLKVTHQKVDVGFLSKVIAIFQFLVGADHAKEVTV